nr:retrovirus-related Pol polyprotein from transposon TNT 1-94 [Tanacetum cinerariifolium]
TPSLSFDYDSCNLQRVLNDLASRSGKGSQVIQITLWYLDSGCSKHMTKDRSQLTNFVNKFLGTVKFKNDHVAKIMGYGDYQIGNVMISRVYYVEGLGHNLFFVGKLCDSNLEVAFHQHTCFIRNLEGVDLLTISRGNNLYTLSLEDMMASSPICLLLKASKTKSWLWHRRLSHLNFVRLTIAALRDELRKLKGKAIVDNVVTTHTIYPKMLKVDVEPIAPRLLNNKTVHSDYLRLTPEQAAILREVVKQGNPKILPIIP